jgi:DNA-binding transcriptional LysR family regulator
LIKFPVRLALPKSHPYANKPQIPLSLLKEEPFIGLNRMYPNYGDVAAGFGVAVVSEPLQKIRAKDVIFRDLAPEDSAWVPAGAAWKPDEVSAPVVSRFVDILVQVCAGGNGESHAPVNSRLN